MAAIRKGLKKAKGLWDSFYNPFPYRHYTKRYSCIFIHIPKAAGTSILSQLQNSPKPHRDHANIKDFYRADAVKAERYFKFAFVRCPYDRIFSAYNYLSDGGNRGGDLKYEKLLEIQGIRSFEQFVLEFLEERHIADIPVLRRQKGFVVDDNGIFRLDFVGYLEQFEKDWRAVAKRLGIKHEEVGVLNPGSGSREQCYFSLRQNPSVRKVIYNLYYEDFEMFGYDPEV